MAGFTHLHVHSHLSLLGGTASVADLAARAAAVGLSHLALTDTNALYGAVAFDRACRAVDVQPILGMAVTLAAPEEGMGAGGPGRLVLLATGPAGYRSLCRLSSAIQAEPDREARAARGLGWEALGAHREGLIALSGGRMGWIERYVRAGDRDAAARAAARLADLYGPDGYVALEVHRPGDRAVAAEVAAIGGRYGLRPAAVQPVYCLAPGDAPRLRLLAAIDHNVRLDEVRPADLPAGGDPNVDLHWLGAAEVAERLADFPDALSNVAEIAERCGPALPDGRPIWPDLELPAGQSPGEALLEWARTGLRDKYGDTPPDGVEDRLRAELAAIDGRGYGPLFLVVADIARFSRQAGVPINTRGSVANSLVAYCTGITHVDPIAHGLLFERFLNPARADLPDIDLDFCSRRRDQVLDYVRRKYGPEHVALVSTVSTLRPLSAARETGKAYGLDEDGIRRLAALMPHGWHPDPRRRDMRTVDDVLAGVDDARLRELIRAAFTVVEQPHHLSVHPGGVVITPGPLTDVVPVQWAPKGFLITQFDHGDVEAIGLPKLDLLGVRALTVLADAAVLVQHGAGPGFRLDHIPPADERTGELLAHAETIGVFQCESEGARRTLRQLRARTVQDLAIANAFFKPGPATGGMARTFVRRYRGEEPVGYLHPALEPILAPTQGVLLFQEQVLRIAREVAGLSWAEADRLRKGMSHFGYGEMQQMQALFVGGCRRPPPGGPGLTQQQAETLWEQVRAFAGYGFNQGHATSYADVAYRCAYLKAHWPAEFLCARLANYGGFHHPAIYMAEAVRLGMAVRPPHVNHSGSRFTLGREEERAVLWMGLGQVRDLRQASVRGIVAGRRERPFAGVRDLAARVPLQHKELVHLVQCGALDGLGSSRAAMLAEAADLERAGSALQMAFDLPAPAVSPETAAERLAWERRILGQPVSVHPLDIVAARLGDRVPLRRLAEMPGRRVTTAAVRLPGWTGGRGIFVGDGDTFVIAKSDATLKAPPQWEPVVLHGHWVVGEWEMGWLHVEHQETAALSTL